MPKRHTGVKHPRDPAQLAKLIVDIATGEVDDRERTPEDRGVDPAASAMGRKGGKARAANMSAEERSRNSQKRRTFTLGCHERGRDLSLEASGA